MNPKEIMEQRARLHRQMTALVDKAKAEKRAMTKEENEQFDRIDADITALGQDLARAQTYEAHQAAQNATREPQMEDIGTAATQRDAGRAAATDRAFDAYVRRGFEGMTAEDRQLMQSRFVHDASPQAALTPATGVGGGYTVPTGFSGKIESAMKWYGGMTEFAEIMDTETGQPIPYPTDNDTGNTGEIVGPNVQVSQAQPSFGNVIFTAYKFSSKLVLVPFELLQDSYFDLDSYLANKLGIRLGRIMNNKFTVGVGGGTEPTGLITAAAAAGLIVTMPNGNTATISVENFTDLEHSVDKTYRPGSKFMINDLTLKLVKKLKDSQGRSLWLPGLASSLQAGYPDTLNGYPYIINNDMPIPGANNYLAAFGQGSAFKIRRVSGYTVLRLTERYADYGQVGFLCFMRADSNLVDAGTHPVALLQNSAT